MRRFSVWLMKTIWPLDPSALLLPLPELLGLMEATS
jgi:hypothetical protein